MTNKTDISLRWLMLREDDQQTPASTNSSTSENADNGQPAGQKPDQNNSQNQTNEQNKDQENNEQNSEQNNEKPQEQIDPGMIKELNTTMKALLDEMKKLAANKAQTPAQPQQQQVS